ncbi:MAG: ABC transporter permease, partial [Streptococcaceae bacterium]|nr:ABC transporter permease [Streptococcaceae bacterium]
MNKLFYPKLAITNMKKNARIYLPYLLASTFIVSMFFIIVGITTSKEIGQMPYGEILIQLFGFGCFIIALFSAILLFYTNNFLMKQRQKELGLYNILGMEKKHIAKLLFFETFFTAVTSILAGVMFGGLFSRFIYLVLIKVAKFENNLAFHFQPIAFLSTFGLFLTIFLLILLITLIKVRLSNPIELLKGGNVGEKEPKTKWIMASLGLILLVIAYYIALTITSPVQAIVYFFLAVLMVIVGTYFLFIAGSIVVLKMLRKNKKFYYQAKHFIAISGMIYRMKQHAVGLASISILSTMVLVSVATTVSLYVGQTNVLQQMFPREFVISHYGENEGMRKKADALVNEQLATQNLEKNQSVSYLKASMYAKYENETLKPAQVTLDGKGFRAVTIITLADFNQTAKKNYTLATREILVYAGDNHFTSPIQLGTKQMKVSKYLENIPPILTQGEILLNILIVTKDEKSLFDLVDAMDAKRTFTSVSYMQFFNTNGTQEEKMNFTKDFQRYLDNSKSVSASFSSKAQTSREFGSLFGVFLFLGIFLGMLFIMATSLIIYYKQISEGYEDKERFQIMQRVGLSKEQVRASIASQTLMVFFLPLVVAVIHLAFSFNMTTRMLAAFQLTDVRLFVF